MKIKERIILIIAIGYSLLHSLILMNVLPHDVVWGGKIDSAENLYLLETLALITMLFLGYVILARNRIIKSSLTDKSIKRILFLFAMFFCLNTVGNLLAETNAEKLQALITTYLSIALYSLSRY